MLSFFRKYQKGFFFVVTFFIVVSFVFFGTSSAFLNREKVPDREIGHLVDGTPLKEQKLEGLIRLLKDGIEEGGQGINLLNDSVVHHEFILSDLGLMLAEHHYEEIAPELQGRWKRAKHFIPYVHPYAPSISAKGAWGQFCPKLIDLFEELANAPEELNKESLSLLFRFYQAQADFPPPLLHQMLYYQQGQNQGIRPDPGLPQANVALFGFQSLEDWFGKTFLNEIGKFILNCACLARQEGYTVTLEEAQVDLYSNVYRGLKSYFQGENLTKEDVEKHFTRQLQHVGLNENQAASLWREVALFRRLFHEIGKGVFLDPLALKQFKHFAKPSHLVCTYRLPKSLQFHNFREMLKFQRYLEIVGEGDLLNLPTHLRLAENVMQDYPELVFKTFEVEMASVSKGEVAGRISLRETWEWEAKEENFQKLQKEFPSLQVHKGEEVEGRIHALDALEESTRFKVDQFARNLIVDENIEKIDRALADASVEKQTLKVCLKKGEALLSGENFLGLLEIEDPQLEHYTPNNENYYAIKVLSKGKGWNLFSYEELDRSGVIDRLLDDLLEAAYSNLGFKEPFEEVKDQVGMKIYADLLRSIETHCMIKEISEYPAHRFDGYLEEMRTLAEQDSQAFHEKQNAPWFLEKIEEKISMDDVLCEGDFSPIRNGQFYQLLEKTELELSENEISGIKEYLKKDAEQEFMRKVLKVF